MTFLIDCTTQNRKYRWVLRKGEAARVGCSPWVEFCIEDDVDLSPEHFLTNYSDKLVLHAIDHATVEIGGVPVTTTTIVSGTNVLAGKSTIHFTQIHAKEIDTSTPPVSIETVVSQTQPYVWDNKPKTVELVKLSPEGTAAIASAQSPLAAIEGLVSKTLDEDAVRLLAGCLPTMPLIQWVSQALQNHGIPTDASRMQMVQRWLSEPNEPLRSEIESRICWTENSSPWTWVYAAIAWTASSKEPLLHMDVAATPEMIVSAMIAALQLASCQTDMRSFRKDCIAKGLQYLIAFQRKEHHLAASCPTQ